MRTCIRTAAVLLLVFALPSFARADEGGAREDLKAKIKKKMEEIRRLMAENEKALLELSTGAKDKPRRVDVEVPDAPEGGAKGGSDEPKTGEDIARRLRELIEGQRSKGGRIPQEIEKLLKMIPRGQGQGQPQDGKPQDGKKKEPQSLRDARKKLDEQKRQGEKPERGDESQPARSDKMRTKPEPPEKEPDAARKDNVPAWVTALPPEIRDALAGGQAEKIPARYRHLIARYNLYLQKKASERGR